MAKRTRASSPRRKDTSTTNRPIADFETSSSEKESSGESVNEQFMREARDRFQIAMDATKEQRKREIDDLRFYAGDQWPEDIKQARAGQSATNGLPPVPARPCLVINKIREPIRQVLNQERDSDFGVEIVAADDFGTGGPVSEAEIKLREGLVRRVQRVEPASDARTWGFSRSAIAGQGYYAVFTRYAKGKTFDQEVYIHRFYDQNSVVLDPSHEQPDGSDAKWEFVSRDYFWEEYKGEFPTLADKTPNPVIDTSDDEFRALGQQFPKWFRMQGNDGTQRVIRVTDYFYTVWKTITYQLLSDGRTIEKDKDPIPDGLTVVDTREEGVRTIKWAKIDGKNRLDETDWQGRYMPIVKVLGEELHPYDDDRRVEGMVRPTRDSQQGFNAMVSKWVEVVGLAPIPPFQATPEQISGFEAWYAAANTRTLPYLPYNLISEAGEVLAAPTRTPVDTPVTAIAGSVQMFAEAIQSTTAVPDPQLGKIDPSLRSGKAVEALQAASQHGTSNFLDNLKRSIRYEGQIINDLLYNVYGKQPGRIVRMMTSEGKTMPITLGQTPTGEGQPAYTLTDTNSLDVVIKVTKSFENRQMQLSAMLAQIITAEPGMMTWFGDLFFKAQQGPESDEMAKRAEVMLDPRIQAYRAQEQQAGQQVPPAALAKIAQLEEQVKRAEDVMQQQRQEMDAKEIEQKGKIQIEAMRAKLDVQLQRMKDATTLYTAKLDALTKGVIADRQAEVEQIALDHAAAQASIDREFDADEAIASREHEAAEAAKGRNQEILTQTMGQAHQAASADQAAGHAATAAEQQAELARSTEPAAE